MGKLAFFTDSHFGVRGSNAYFDDIMMEFFSRQFFPECKKNSVTDIICLGDFTDNRKQINFRTLHTIKYSFLPLLEEYGITLHIFDGNHDIFYKHTNEISSMMVLADDPNVVVYKEPTEVVFGDTKFLFVPWLNDNNFEPFYKVIEKSDADVCLGHFEFSGALLYKNSISVCGLSPSLFKHFKKVYVGHYHHRNKLDNIQYIGATGYYTWQDYNDYRGMMLLDTSTLDETYIENKHSLFKEVIYEDELFDSLVDTINTLENRVVKIIVKSKENLVNYESYIQKLYKMNIINFTLLDETRSITTYKDDNSKEIVELEDVSDKPIVEMIKAELETEEEFKEIESIFNEALLAEDL